MYVMFYYGVIMCVTQNFHVLVNATKFAHFTPNMYEFSFVNFACSDRLTF